MTKKKEEDTPLTSTENSLDWFTENGEPSSRSSQDIVTKLNVFKSSSFANSVQKSGKKRQWKTLKQILASEAAIKWPEDCPTYASIDAPPSFIPAKKYSDISGMEAAYTDPQTKINFAFVDEFKVIRKLPSDIVAGYLSLRRANTQLQ